MSLRTVYADRPVLAAVGCAALQFAVTVLILAGGPLLLGPSSAGPIRLVAFASTIVLPLVLAQVTGLWGPALGVRHFRSSWPFLLSLVTPALFLSRGINVPTGSNPVVDLLIQLANAFGEEMLFRGVVFALLLRLNPWKATIINGLLFGSMHFIHLFMGGEASALAWQVAATSIAGMMFTAVRYGTGSLWLTILLHMLLNLSMMYSNIEAAAGAGTLFLIQRAANVVELAVAAIILVTYRPRPRTAQCCPETGR